MWRENEAPLTVLVAMRKQLRRCGMGGQIYGLDYNVLPWVMQQVGILPADTAEVFGRVQIAEDALVEYCNSGR